MVHELKILPQFYEPVSKGLKTFEVRHNDRGFQMGDTVVLKEWIPGKLDAPEHYTKSPALEFIVGYVYPISSDMVAFSLLPQQKAPATPAPSKVRKIK